LVGAGGRTSVGVTGRPSEEADEFEDAESEEEEEAIEVRVFGRG
jgi:hypothetical protein